MGPRPIVYLWRDLLMGAERRARGHSWPGPRGGQTLPIRPFTPEKKSSLEAETQGTDKNPGVEDPERRLRLSEQNRTA